GRRTAPRRPVLSALGWRRPGSPGHPALPSGRPAPGDAAAVWGVRRRGGVSLHVSGPAVSWARHRAPDVASRWPGGTPRAGHAKEGARVRRATVESKEDPMSLLHVEGVTHWSIPVNNLEEAEAFYGDLLGLTPVGRLGTARMACFTAGGHNILLCERA